MLLCAVVGFMGRSRQLAKKERKIGKLECDMVERDAEILAVQRENVLLEARIKDITNPVIAMKGNKLEDKSRSTGAK